MRQTAWVDISARVDYAVRAMLILAESDAEGSGPISIDSLSTRQELPRKFLEAIFADLRRGSLVLSRRGEPCKFEPQVFDVLRLLVEHRDRVVPKEELLRFNNHLLNYEKEAGLNDLATAGLSPDYVARETKRVLENR